MMPISPPEKEINFIVEEETKNKETLKDKIFQWVIQKGRIIIIITQAIVLIAFLSRFKLDSDFRNLIREIDANNAVLESNIELESEYSRVAARSVLIKRAIDQQINWGERLEAFNQNIPQGISLDQLVYSEDEIRFSARSPSASTFQFFVQAIIADENAQEIVLESSRYDRNTQEYAFSLRIYLKQP